MYQSRFCAAGLAVVLLLGTARAQSSAPLADAAERKDHARVAELLKQGATVNAAQADGMMALHWAAYHDDSRMAVLLIKAGADAKAANTYGVTALAMACTNGNTEIVESLLKAGADANAAQRGGETVLMTAARTGKPGPVKALIARGANVNAKDRKGQTALMWAAADGHVEAVQALLAAGADFKTPLASGFTPLHFAAREGRADVVRLLVKTGADVNEAMQPSKSPGRAPKYGTSALMLAVENGHFELALDLVKAGADPNDQRSGCGALHMLSWVRKPNRGDSDDGDPPPIGSGKLTSLEFAREMVKHGANVNLVQKKGMPGRGILGRVGATPLIGAASTSDVLYVRTLLELGADIKLANADRTTPLLAAAGVGVGAPEEAAGSEPEALEVLDILVKLGADVNAVDKSGDTAVHGASYRNHPKVVQFLADKGMKIDVWNQKNKTGLTPLVIAEGHRPGLNFRPSPETVAALHRVMIAAGMTPPPPSEPRPLTKFKYDDAKKKAAP
jgi:ankyrin repeat protein